MTVYGDATNERRCDALVCKQLAEEPGEGCVRLSRGDTSVLRAWWDGRLEGAPTPAFTAPQMAPPALHRAIQRGLTHSLKHIPPTSLAKVNNLSLNPVVHNVSYLIHNFFGQKIMFKA